MIELPSERGRRTLLLENSYQDRRRQQVCRPSKTSPAAAPGHQGGKAAPIARVPSSGKCCISKVETRQTGAKLVGKNGVQDLT